MSDIHKLRPDRSMYLRGFDRRGVAAFQFLSGGAEAPNVVWGLLWGLHVEKRRIR